MILIKEHSNYYKVEIENKDGYADWIKELDCLCIPINEKGKEKVIEYSRLFDSAGLPYKIMSFEKSNISH